MAECVVVVSIPQLRHRDVQDRDVGGQGLGHLDRRPSVARLAAHLPAGLALELALQPVVEFDHRPADAEARHILAELDDGVPEGGNGVLARGAVAADGRREVIATDRPANALRRLDFPTFGAPSSATSKPSRSRSATAAPAS